MPLYTTVTRSAATPYRPVNSSATMRLGATRCVPLRKRPRKSHSPVCCRTLNVLVTRRSVCEKAVPDVPPPSVSFPRRVPCTNSSTSHGQGPPIRTGDVVLVPPNLPSARSVKRLRHRTLLSPKPRPGSISRTCALAGRSSAAISRASTSTSCPAATNRWANIPAYFSAPPSDAPSALTDQGDSHSRTVSLSVVSAIRRRRSCRSAASLGCGMPDAAPR